MKVSIIVPCYNQELFLEECLMSVASQTYKDWECIVVNDGSTDNSVNVVKRFIKEDTRFKLISQVNSGVAAARNNGINIAKGELILPLDGDDKIGKNYLKQGVFYFEKHPEVTLVYCNAIFFGEKKGKWKLSDYKYEEMLLTNHVFCSAIYKKNDFLTKTNGYDSNLKYGYEDWDFWLQLLNKDSLVHKLPDCMFYYRQKEGSRDTFTADRNKYKETLDLIYAKHYEKYNCLLKEKGHNVIELLNIYNKYIVAVKKMKVIKKSISYKVFYKIECFFLLRKK